MLSVPHKGLYCLYEVAIVCIFVGPSYLVEVTDGASTDHHDISLKDWMTYSSNDSREGLLIMSVEFSRTRLEKCIKLPEIVRFVS